MAGTDSDVSEEGANEGKKKGHDNRGRTKARSDESSEDDPSSDSSSDTSSFRLQLENAKRLYRQRNNGNKSDKSGSNNKNKSDKDVSRNKEEESLTRKTRKTNKKPDYHETDESADEGSPYVPRVLDEDDEELVVDLEDENH